jgi:hypothetical protein
MAEPSMQRMRWLVPLLVIGLGGTLLSLKLREMDAPDPCEGIGRHDATTGRCSLELVMPQTDSLTAECGPGQIGFSYPRLEAPRYGCPRGFTITREGRTARCTAAIGASGEPDCKALGEGHVTYTPAQGADGPSP